MTTKEDQPLDENEESTLDQERESEESENLEDLFADDDDSEDESDADKVKRLEDKIARIEKGVKKLATDKGREAKQPEKTEEPKEEPKTEPKEEPKKEPKDDGDLVEELLLIRHPEAEHVLDELKETAEMKGTSVLKLYRDSKYFQGEAKALADAQKSEEENKSKIKKPANGTPSSKKDVLATKPEDVEKLSPSEKAQWLKAQAEKERNSDD